MEEKALQAKLEVLFRKNLYLLAINVAKSHRSRRPGVTRPEETGRLAGGAAAVEHGPHDQLLGEIYRRYGDHLYAKGDYDGAMAQFVKTIGLGTQPSYIIRQASTSAPCKQAAGDSPRSFADRSSWMLSASHI